MSEVIQGAHSSKYFKDLIPGVPNSGDTFTHQSVQDLWDGRGASDTLIHGVSILNALPATIEAGSVKRKIKSTGHPARKGDFIRLNDGLSEGEEIAIIQVIDADYFVIAKEINASVGDEIFFLRAVTPAYNPDGTSIVTITPAPIMYDRKAAGITTATNVLEDLDTPAASKPLPVAIHSIDGAGITINAGDLSVSTSHVNDSVSLGDGTTLVGATVNNELKTHDADSLGVLADILAELELKADLTESQPVKQDALAPFYNQSLVIDNVTVVTIAKPVGAKKAKVWAGDNADALRITLDGATVPSATVGFPLNPNRAEDFDGVGDLKVIAQVVSTNQAIYIHWSI